MTFLGNHDMGRIGAFLKQDNPKADDAELVDRARLADEVMFLSRGNPVVYYGDEQGFTGAGGDKDARQTMFASKTADYLDDDQLGTDRTHASDAYDTGHPLYRNIAALSELTRKNPALRDGVQTERYAEGSVYAFSRTDPERSNEYVVATNNGTAAKTVELPTASAAMNFRTLYGGSGTVRSGSDKKITVTVPALASIVLRAENPLGAPTAKPSIALTAPAAGATGTVEISADVDGGSLNRVVFAAQTGNGAWVTLGSADHAPYKVTQHVDSKVAAGTPLRYKAVVVDRTGRTASALASTTAGQAPAEGKPVAVERDHAVVHYKRTDGDYDGWHIESGDTSAEFTGRDAYGAFAWIKLDDGVSSVPYTVEKDGTADGPQRTVDLARTGQVWIEQGKDGQADEAPEGAYPAQDTTKAVLHYHRADGDYDGWGLHTWTGAKEPTDWSKPLQPVKKDAYGVTFEVPLTDGATSLSYILHKGDEKDLPSDQSLDIATYDHEVWMIAGQPGYLLPQTGGVPTPTSRRPRHSGSTPAPSYGR